MTHMRFLPFLAVIMLIGCASSEASLEVAFSSALSGAIAYDELPPCKLNGPQICSQRVFVLKIKDAKEAAYSALKVARAMQTNDTTAAARQAIEAFNSILAMPEVQAAITAK